jgi:hypothetical protein
MENKFETLTKMIESIDSKSRELSNSEIKLEEKVEKLNNILFELEKAYRHFGKFTEITKEILTRKTYKIKLNELKYNHQNSESEKRETYVSESMNLNIQRWKSILEFKSKWKKDRGNLRNKLDEKLNNLSSNKNLGMKEMESLFTELKTIINKEEKLITAEFNLQDELELIYKRKLELIKEAENLLLE